MALAWPDRCCRISAVAPSGAWHRCDYAEREDSGEAQAGFPEEAAARGAWSLAQAPLEGELLVSVA